ncbi:hypothetical protein FD37_GL001056 [Levilactobacillus spicheri DSM 15429]|uniref:HAD superfamily hydrolase n=1 Tax=Levilactobacillus spicheri DSM 15429 TaxID=1423805 RepID=A0A0R1R3E8_9LACO|nr:hypothetical protein FD37_GL001056 [Levilactobacillus spicheri DSM 15429]
MQELGIQGADQYVVTYNGAVTQSVTGGILGKHLLSADDFERIRVFCDQHQVHFNALDDQSQIYTPNQQISWQTVRQAAENQAGIQMLAPQDFPIRFPLAKVMLADEPAKLDTVESAFRALFGERYYIVRSQPYFLEVLNRQADKGHGLTDLMTHLGLESDELVGIGDEANDLPMFTTVGTAVAMGNAHPEIQQAADWVTADNDHDGVAQAIDRLLAE